MNLRDAAQRALEALEQSIPKGNPSNNYNDFGFTRHFAAIDALRAALAEPVQEPGCDHCLRSVLRTAA